MTRDEEMDLASVIAADDALNAQLEADGWITRDARGHIVAGPGPMRKDVSEGIVSKTAEGEDAQVEQTSDELSPEIGRCIDAICDFVIGREKSLREEFATALTSKNERITEIETRLAALETTSVYQRGVIDTLRAIDQPSRTKLLKP